MRDVETVRRVGKRYQYKDAEYYVICFARQAYTEEEALREITTEMSIKGWKKLKKTFPHLCKSLGERFEHPDHFVHDLRFITARGGMWWEQLSKQFIFKDYPEAILIGLSVYSEPFTVRDGVTFCKGKINRSEGRKIEKVGHNWDPDKENSERMLDGEDPLEFSF